MQRGPHPDIVARLMEAQRVIAPTAAGAGLRSGTAPMPSGLNQGRIRV
jgi:hypothetical protein